jgi:hypothetical protein
MAAHFLRDPRLSLFQKLTKLKKKGTLWKSKLMHNEPQYSKLPIFGPFRQPKAYAAESRLGKIERAWDLGPENVAAEQHRMVRLSELQKKNPIQHVSEKTLRAKWYRSEGENVSEFTDIPALTALDQSKWIGACWMIREF